VVMSSSVVTSVVVAIANLTTAWTG
jgi:hypothetical protein